MIKVFPKRRLAIAIPLVLLVLFSATACFLLNLPPIAVFFASPISGSAPLVVSLDATGSSDSDGSIVSYEWTYGDGSTGSGEVGTHTYELPGAYIVHLTVIDDDGATAKATQLTIQVSAAPPASNNNPPGSNNPPTASFTASPATGLAPLDVDFDATGSSDSDGLIASYAWIFGDGAISSGVTASHTYSSAGNYTAQLTVTDDDGAAHTASRTIQVSSAPPDPNNPPASNNSPTASFTASPTTGSAPLDVDFDASGSSDSDGSIASYAWTFGDGGSALGATPSHTYTSEGNYTAQLTVTDNDGATDTATRTVQVSAAAIPAANDSPTASFTASPATGSAALNVDFNASGSSDADGSIALYAWVFGDGGSSLGVSPSHTYNSAGTYTAELTVTDDDGATDTTTRTIEVSEAPSGPNNPPTAGFYATKIQGAPPLAVDFYTWASSDSDGSIVSYAWTFGDGASASGATTSHTYNSLGTYTVTLTVTDDDGATDSTTKKIVVVIGGC